ncbi:hypothetical protein [Nocardiopsis ganjiahuensis]|uniref:hypothetical protein n=1 Tax=Nocardiopsis ganjiahuensis TaxID=239984 RepID=UPI0004760A01|nr:hypothetical protein [Nocardiopsis ganjiahuensis]
MPQQASAATALRPATTEHAPRPRTASVSLDGIGDVVDAGRSSGYAHLSERRLPTLGQLVSAARGAAVSLRRPTLWPTRRGRWQPAPRSARRHVSGRFRVTAVALEPNSFVPGPVRRSDRPHNLEVLHLVSGRAHLITSGADGQMRSAAELAVGRTRVVGDSSAAGQGHHYLVNTGDEVAVLVRVTA